MKLGYCGINYKTAGLDIRDKTAFTDSRKMEVFQKAEEAGISQCMVLATCNRSEIYYLYDSEDKQDHIKDIFLELFPDVELRNTLNTGSDRDAMNYLFCVAAGLESQVLGEDQILGQLKDAIDFSRAMGHSGKELNKIVRDAVTCAKKIKTELKISEIPLSVSYVGIRKLQQECGIQDKNVLVLGSGQTASLALRYVYAYGASKITICNRTISNAKKLKTEFPEIHIGDFEDRYKIMEDCDIVISATSAPHLVIREEYCRVRKDMYFLDLAAPRDIDTAICRDARCKLINLDTLDEVVQENRKEREALKEQGLSMIIQAVEDTMNWMGAARVDDTIASLQMKCDEIIEDSFEYLNRKIELSSREQMIIKRTLDAAFRRLLKEPIAELKKLETPEEQNQYKDTLEKLFQI
ncbi:MAG: glutamyl-tRNA reductase [Lachnospiraceae bacterium]|nr:glutamyl-tRNA reductase [Lachnospiraceae bacterium]